MFEEIFKLGSKNNHFISLTLIQYEKCIRINQSIKNPEFFDIDENFMAYITNHKKKFDSYLVDCDFKLDLIIDIKPHNRTDFYHKTTTINLKSFLICWFDLFILRGFKVLHINILNITGFNEKGN